MDIVHAVMMVVPHACIFTLKLGVWVYDLTDMPTTIFKLYLRSIEDLSVLIFFSTLQ